MLQSGLTLPPYCNEKNNIFLGTVPHTQMLDTPPDIVTTPGVSPIPQ